MLFNSVEFAHFFIVVFGTYLLLPRRGQNLLLLASSYYFYGSWDPRFLVLLLISTIIDFLCGLWIERSSNLRTRKIFLWCSIVANLGILGLFKYYNFFISNLLELFRNAGIELHAPVVTVLLPLGISFYTFQTMSYTIDVYRKRIPPSTQFLDFALFVSFFPQLLAGPIETARNLLPQILERRELTRQKLNEGVYLIFWGLFEKIVVADNLNSLIYQELTAGPPYNGLTVLLGTYAGAFVILCDFDGYSNIARGLGKCMGFDILINFRFPYISANPVDLWKRWHISMTSWFRDYVYVSLGAHKSGLLGTVRNVLITFFLVGLWHGANWALIIWGLFHGLIVILHRLLLPFLDRISPQTLPMKRAWFVFRVVVVFHIWSISGLLFFLPSLPLVSQLLNSLLFNFHFDLNVLSIFGYKVFLFCSIPFLVQCLQYRSNDLLIMTKLHPLITAAFYIICFYLMVISGIAPSAQNYIYFQF